MITAPIILTGGGKFPFVDGVPQIYTRDQFEECCCPATCNGDTTLDAYTITAFSFYTDIGARNRYRVRPSDMPLEIVRREAPLVCRWEPGEHQLEQSDSDGNWTFVSGEISNIRFDEVNERWVFEVLIGDGALSFTALKPNGGSPAGNYVLDTRNGFNGELVEATIE
jgi:hypothetical protein